MEKNVKRPLVGIPALALSLGLASGCSATVPSGTRVGRGDVAILLVLALLVIRTVQNASRRHQKTGRWTPETLPAVVPYLAVFASVASFRIARRYFERNGLSQIPDWLLLLVGLLGALVIVVLVFFLVGWAVQKGRRVADGD
jgi:protein-S-isoprenylcysteine O-methyltransferase Ste14